MKLTEITRKLKNTFVNEYEVAADLSKQLGEFRRTYHDAESVRIGEMDYIVIDEVYNNDSGRQESISSIFFDSINNNYAIIDLKTSSTLIDEVYSRVVYMQKDCKDDSPVDKVSVAKRFLKFIGDETTSKTYSVTGDDADSADGSDVAKQSKNQASIFQCHLIKNTGVSASNDVYTFMLRNGEIKEVTDSAIDAIRGIGEIRFLLDNDVLEKNKPSIQKAIFDKYTDSDIDIESVNVKSIFEISMSFAPIQVNYVDQFGNDAVFRTVSLKSNIDLDMLNDSIHVCNSCGHDLLDLKDLNKINQIHVNIDAIDEALTNEEKKLVFATGCEECLVKCEKCGRWHFNYKKFADSATAYSKIKLAPGRAFIKNLKFRYENDINYCSCREGIEWVYDETTMSDSDHECGVIPLSEVMFVNYAGEEIASSEEFMRYYQSRFNPDRYDDAIKEQKGAKRIIEDFRRKLASDNFMGIKDIKISSKENCQICSVCGGKFLATRRAIGLADEEFRCDICDAFEKGTQKTITRIDGMIFMRRKVKGGYQVTKYVMTRLGRMKKIANKKPAVESVEIITDETADTAAVSENDAAEK